MMNDNYPDMVQTCVTRNDHIACDLLKTIDRYEQFAIMYSLESSLLHRVFITAVANEDYEICQVITELLDERKVMGRMFNHQ
jgi:hypothetical protein